MPERKPTHELLQEHWGQAIRHARGDRSQTWLAKAVNVDQTTISRIERGVYRLSTRNPRLIGVRKGRVRYFAVASRKLLRNRRALRRHLRLAGLHPVRR